MVDQAEVFRALGDATRQLIVKMLGERQMAAGEIAAAFKVTQPAISHHLNVLRRAGLVSSRREGQRIIYALDRAPLSECWHGFFGRLLDNHPATESWDEKGLGAPGREGGERVSAS